MTDILIDLIAGARPNFMKIAPIIEALKKKQSTLFDYRLIHTGQHYDQTMSAQFFEQLGIPHPNINLEVGSGTQAEQTANIMTRYEQLLFKEPCDLCLVVGDVTSTMACSIVAKKMGVRVAHVEGGIRSGDWTMPEEINRVVTDSIADYFFTTSKTANENLHRSGIEGDRIFFVGNTMIDTLKRHMQNFRPPEFWEIFKLKPGQYFVLTLHRPSNVDELSHLLEMLRAISVGTSDFPIIFPVHPRTKKMLQKTDVNLTNLHFVEPQGYLEFNYLVKQAKGVITDSGGITEETTVMGVPCLTLRNNTERPETVTVGTNELVGTNPEKVLEALKRLVSGQWKEGRIPEKWDGKSAERIVSHLEKLLWVKK